MNWFQTGLICVTIIVCTWCIIEVVSKWLRCIAENTERIANKQPYEIVTNVLLQPQVIETIRRQTGMSEMDVITHTEPKDKQ